MRMRLNAEKKQFDIFSQSRTGAVKGAGDASAFECSNTQFDIFHNPVRER